MAERICRDIDIVVPKLRDKLVDVVDFIRIHNLPLEVFETIRAPHRQTQLVKDGFSRTMKSKHLTGEAADFVVRIDGKWSWNYERYDLQYKIFGLIAEHFGLRWGGRFKSIYDPCHVELA